MAERTNPHANLIIGAQDEASPVFDKIKASSQSMAAGVEQAATKAAGAVGGIGDKAAPAAQKLDGITASMIRQVQRLNAELEAGGARNAAYFEKIASVKGADLSAMAPYLADLKKAEAAQRVATTGLDQMGMSAKQTAAALRQVPMQFTDIVVSLQGGQSAMQVFLQQGGQLKDMFGGVGAAARAMGGYVLGLINPLTVTAAALGTIAVAYNQGSKENDAFVKSIALTGNASGVTVGQLRAYASAIDGVVGTQAQAAEGLAAFVNAGVRGGDELRRYTQTAIEWEKATGQAVSKTAEQFASLQNAPLAAVLKLNEGTNFLTTSVYEQIKSLSEQGRSADASRVAMDALDGAMRSRAQTIQESLGYIERGWNGIKGAAKEAWDAMLNVGRGTTDEQNLAQLRENLARQQERNSTLGIKEGQATADLKEQIRLLERKITLANDSASAQADEAKKAQSLIEWDREGLKYLSDREKMQRELAKAQDDGVKAGKSQEQIESRLAAIRASYDKKTGGGGRVSSENKELAEQAKLIAELSGLTGSFAKDWDRLSAVYAKGGMSLDQLTQAQADLLAKQPAIKAATEEQAKEQQTLAKANLDAAASREKYLTSLSTGLDKIQADIAAQIEATERMGLSKEAIAELDAAKLEMLATDLELQAIKAMDRNLDQQTYDALKKQAAAYRELGIAKKGGAAKEAALDLEKANAEAAKKAQEDWERASEQINQSLTDALLRGFESGKDFAKNLRDTVVNMFKTMVLRPVISAVVNPVAGAITGALGLAGTANAGTSALGAIGTGASILNAGSALGGLGAVGGAIQGFGTAMLSSVQSLMGITGTTAQMVTSLTAAGHTAAAGAATGTQIFQAIPGWGWALAGVAALGSIFGKKKIRDTGIEGDFGGETGFEGQRYTYSKKWFKTKTEYDPLEEETRAIFGDAFIAARSQLRQYGEILSLPIDGIDDFTSHMKLSLKGLNDQEVQEAVATALRDKSNELAQQIIGSWEDVATTTMRYIEQSSSDGGGWFDAVPEESTTRSYVNSEFARDGEKAIDTLTRLATSLGTVNDIWKNLGNTVYEASLAGADAASTMADAFGGLEAMAQATGAYFQNFYSAEEQRAAVERQLNEALGKLNLQLPDIDATDARAQYRALAEAQDRNTEAGREAYVVLLKLSGAFASITAESETAAAAAARLADEQAKAAEAATRAAEEAARRAEEIARERYGLETRLMQLLGDTAGLRKREIEALDASNRALQEHIYAIEDARAAYEKSITAAQSAYSVLESSVGRERDALQKALDAERDAISARYKLQQDGHAAQISAAQAASDKMRGIASMLSGALGRMVVESPALDRARLQSARGVIGAAAASLNVMAPGLEGALSVVAGDVRKMYGKWEDFAFDQGVTAGQTAALSSAAKSQLSGYESIVNALREQDDVSQLLADAEMAAAQERFEIESKKLDERLEQGKSMLDRLLGIEEGTLSSVEALARLTDAVNAGNAALQAQRAAEAAARMAVMQGGGGGGGGGGGAGGPEVWRGQTYTDFMGNLSRVQVGQSKQFYEAVAAAGTAAVGSLSELRDRLQAVGKSDIWDALSKDLTLSYQDVDKTGGRGVPSISASDGVILVAGYRPDNESMQDYATKISGWAQNNGVQGPTNNGYSQSDISNAISTTLGQGASVADILNAGAANFGLTEQEIRDAARAAGIPGFATGINRVPHDMLARIHKDEAVVPAVYNPYNPGASAPGNSEVVAELRELNERLDAIEANTRATAGHAAGTDRKLARVIQNDAIKTETTV